MIRILNSEPLGYHQEAYEVLKQIGVVTEKQCTRKELLSLIGDFEVLIVRLQHTIDKEIIDAGLNLQVIVTATTGLDHIDIDYAKQKGITVLSLKGDVDFLRTVTATSELTMGLILSLYRHLPAAFNSVVEGKWDRDRFRGREIQGKRLGILGLGRLGSKVAEYAAAFGMRVGSFDINPEHTSADIRTFSSMKELLQWSEILTIHVPLNDKTTHLIGIDELTLLPQGAILINTSRGSIVDESALLLSLKSGHIGGAAVDVLENELKGSIIDNPLVAYARDNENVIITPHIGGATWDSMRKTEIRMANKLNEFYSHV